MRHRYEMLDVVDEFLFFDIVGVAATFCFSGFLLMFFGESFVDYDK